MKNTELVKIEKLEQLVNKKIFIGKLNIIQLKEIIRYTSRKSNERDPFNEDLTNLEIDGDLLHYQRVKNSDRAYDIKLFFLKNISNKYNYDKNRISPLGTFPSSIIISLKTNDDFTNINKYSIYISDETEKVKDYSFLKENEIIIPKSKQSLIVDGQHRIAGLELLLEETIKQDIKLKKSNISDFQLNKENYPPYSFIHQEILNFNFIVTFLIDFDPYEQAEIFATVNFNQIKVNKSFYYDIFGSSSRGKSVEKLLHDITSHMNYKEDSPLYKKIKMLGTGEGYFSQSFFVDALMPHFKNGCFSFLYSDFQKNGEVYKLVPKFLKIYFNTILNKIFSEYTPKIDEKKYSSILLKTTGMGAVIKLLPNIFNEIKKKKKISDSSEVFKLDDDEMINIITKIFEDIKNNGEEYFGRSSIFSGGAGKGLQNKLYDKLYKDLGFGKKDEDDNENLLLIL